MGSMAKTSNRQSTPCCCGKYTFPTFELETLDWSWEPITDDDGVHERDRCLSGLRDDAMDDVVRPSDVVEECRCQDRPSGSADPVGRSFDEVEGSPKNDVTLSRRPAEDLLEILGEFRSQHLREAAWRRHSWMILAGSNRTSKRRGATDYPQFDFQRRMLANLDEIETQVYQSMQGLSE